MSNMAFIYQPHFKTKCFRVAVSEQRGIDYNYVVVTCSPQYNGIWKYPASNTRMYSHWKNKNVECLCVPIRDCKYVQTLDSIGTTTIINKVKSQQLKWYNNSIVNRNYTYAEKPNWML